MKRGARCGLPVVDAERRARTCGAKATTTREIDGIDFAACALCAATVDAAHASGKPFMARDLAAPAEKPRGSLDWSDPIAVSIGQPYDTPIEVVHVPDR